MSVVALNLRLNVIHRVQMQLLANFMKLGGLGNFPCSIIVYTDLFCLFSITDFMRYLIDL